MSVSAVHKHSMSLIIHYLQWTCSKMPPYLEETSPLTWSNNSDTWQLTTVQVFDIMFDNSAPPSCYKNGARWTNEHRLFLKYFYAGIVQSNLCWKIHNKYVFHVNIHIFVLKYLVQKQIIQNQLIISEGGKWNSHQLQCVYSSRKF